MKRRFFAMLLALALVCSLLPGTALAADPESPQIINGVEYTLNAAKDAWEVTHYYSGTDIIIESKIENISVTAIKANVFSNTGITSVIIPDSVKTIGTSAFAKCTSLKKVTIQNAVKENTAADKNEIVPIDSIGFQAFANCTALETFVGSAKVIGEQAFVTCSNLATVIIPGKVETIKSLAFSACGKLSAVYLGGDASTKVEGIVFQDVPSDLIIHVSSSFNKDELRKLANGLTTHRANEYVVPTQPRCTAEGSIVTQVNCNGNYPGCTFTHTETRTIPALGHDWEVLKQEPADGTFPACKDTEVTIDEKCKRCNDEQTRTDVIKATIEHNYQPGDLEEILESTCTLYGAKISNHKCNVCEDERFTQEELEALAKKYQEYLDIKETLKDIDSKIAEVEQAIVDKGTAITNKAGEINKKAGEITAKAEAITAKAGEITAVETEIKELDPDASDYEEEKARLDAKKAKLEEEKRGLESDRDGLIKDKNELYDAKTALEADEKKLKDEEKALKDELAKLKNQDELKKKQDEDLKALLEADYVTKDANNSITFKNIESIRPAGHVWDDGRLSPDQKEGFNCETDTHGTVIYTCKVCGAEETRKDVDLNLLGTRHIAIPDGQLNDNQKLRLEAEIRDNKDEKYVEATCTPDDVGVVGRVPHICSICDNIFWVDVPAPDHVHGEPQTIITKEPTCQEEGEQRVGREVCTVCGKVFVEGTLEVLAKGEHSAVPGSGKTEITKKPTCTEPGEEVTTAECSVCHTGFKTIKVLPPTGHTIGGDVTETITKEPTCTEEGTKTITGMGTCTVCGETIQADGNGATFTIPALGHNFGEWKTNDDGSRTRKCTRCDLTETVDKDGNLIDPDNPAPPPEKPVDPNKLYNIRLGSILRGTVVRSATTAKAGTTITLTAYANAGFELSDIHVDDADKNRIPITADGGTVYTFVMPTADVTVYATFADAYSSNPPSTGASKPSTSTKPETPNKWNGVPVNQDTPNASASWTGFYDVPSTHWASGEILWAYQNGFMTADSSGGFKPNDIFTGGQLWVALARLMGQRPRTVTEAQQWAMRNGFADGIGPNTKVTRQQLVVALYRCAGLLGRATNTHGSLTGYIDSATVPAAARNAMSWAVMHGIIGGTADKRLNPKGTTTRAQFAVILYRFARQIM